VTYFCNPEVNRQDYRSVIGILTEGFSDRLHKKRRNTIWTFMITFFLNP